MANPRFIYSNLILIILTPFLCYGQWGQIGQNINGEMRQDQLGSSISINSDGNIIAIGAYSGGDNGEGQVFVYEYNSGVWAQLGQTLYGASNAFHLGSSVSINNEGNIVAAGSILYGEDGIGARGRARVFEYVLDQWIEIGDDIVGEGENDFMGEAISLNGEGNIVAVSAPNHDLNSGQVKIFQFISGNWVQLGSDINGESNGMLIGEAISLNDAGNIITVSSTSAGIFTGRVWVYRYIDEEWEQIGNSIDGENDFDQFGEAISINAEGNIVAISVPGYDDLSGNNIGQIKIFENIADNWIEIGGPIYGELDANNFGETLSINAKGNIIAIGEKLNDDNGENSGHVKVYKFDGVTWTQVDNDINGSFENNQFGSRVDINDSGNRVIISAIHSGVEFDDFAAGQVFVFENELLSIEESNLEIIFKMHPNPTSKTLFFETNLELKNALIYNLNGRLVYNLTSNNIKKIDVSNLNSGFYLLKLSNENNSFIKKLIIN